MKTYRVFMDYNASFIVNAEEIEDSEGGYRYGLRWTRLGDGMIVRFILTVGGDLLNVDHIVRIMPMRYPEGGDRE